MRNMRSLRAAALVTFRYGISVDARLSENGDAG